MGLVVQHHKIDRQAAEGPPGPRPQQRMHQAHPAGRLDAHQHDRFVSRNAEAPELALIQWRAFDPRPWRAVHQRRGQILQPHLGQRGGHAGGAFNVHRLQILVDARRQFAFSVGGGRGEAQPGHGAGCQAQLHAQAGHGVKTVDRAAASALGLRQQCRLMRRLVAAGEQPAISDAVHRKQFGPGVRQKV